MRGHNKCCAEGCCAEPAWMLIERSEECERDPLVPCAVTENCPGGGIERSAEHHRYVLTAATEKGLVGLLIDMPEGHAGQGDLHVSAKPFSEVTETVTGELVPPCGRLTEEEESEMVKSGCGGGGWMPPPPLPPPQPAVNTGSPDRGPGFL